MLGQAREALLFAQCPAAVAKARHGHQVSARFAAPLRYCARGQTNIWPEMTRPSRASRFKAAMKRPRRAQAPAR
jgi:hypothetical protein